MGGGYFAFGTTILSRTALALWSLSQPHLVLTPEEAPTLTLPRERGREMGREHRTQQMMASANDVAYASAVSLLDLYRRRELSPVEATRLILDRVDALQPRINAFCVVDRDGALTAARASEGRWLRGERVGRLDGV